MARNTSAVRGIGNIGGSVAPLGVLVLTQAGLNNLLRKGATSFDGDSTATRTTRTARDTGTTKRATKRAKTATTKRQASGNAGRGRVAGSYFPKSGVRKLPDDVNPKTAKVFDFIAKNRKTGITQKALVKKADMPNSTVWYALQNLQKKLKVIEYREQDAA